MGAYRFSVKTIYHAGVVILGIFATTMMVLGIVTVEKIASWDMIGFQLRLALAALYAMYHSGSLFLFCKPRVSAGPSPESFISIDKLYYAPEERTFLIDLFSVETLETYLLNYFQM